MVRGEVNNILLAGSRLVEFREGKFALFRNFCDRLFGDNGFVLTNSKRKAIPSVDVESELVFTPTFFVMLSFTCFGMVDDAFQI